MIKFTPLLQQWMQPHMKSTPLMYRLHLDGVLLAGISLILGTGLLILYSASNQNLALLERQLFSIILAYIVMILFAQIPPEKYRLWSPWLFAVSLLLLVAVLGIGELANGGRRWLNIGVVRFQPSELVKITLPLMIAWYLRDKHMPPSKLQLILTSFIILVPFLLIAKEPDLGTALVVAGSGICVLFLTGISWGLIISLLILSAGACPVVWHFMHDYQRRRVLTFLNPENDPLGAGYHIIQSKIAIGSGGIFGKGWLHGTQSHLQFLPEHATDFIFAVCGEELGLVGCVAILALYLFVVARCLYIASQAQTTFARVLTGALTLTFFLSFLINTGMVIGALPVVGVPLPLISYGGTAIVSSLAAFGIMMSIHTHRRLLGK